jgi:hypothetical protein
MNTNTIRSVDSSLSAFEKVLARTLDSVRDLRKNLEDLQGLQISENPETKLTSENQPEAARRPSMEVENTGLIKPNTPSSSESGSDSKPGEGTKHEDASVPAQSTEKERKNHGWMGVLPGMVLAKPNAKPREILKSLITSGHIDKNDSKQIRNARSAIWYYLQKSKARSR